MKLARVIRLRHLPRKVKGAKKGSSILADETFEEMRNAEEEERRGRRTRARADSLSRPR